MARTPKEKWDGKFPFTSASGSLMDYITQWEITQGKVVFKTKDECRFTGTLTYTGYGKGRSSATLNFKDSKGRNYSFFLSRGSDIIAKLVLGKLEGTFVPIKAGQNFSWALEEAEKERRK